MRFSGARFQRAFQVSNRADGFGVRGRHAMWRCCAGAVGRGGKSMKSILDPTFRYVPSVETDLRKTFARVRREMRSNTQREEAPTAPNVLPIQRRNVAPLASR
jgi:hypothetical protein